MRHTLFACLLAAGCAPAALPLPMTAAQAADDHSGAALVAYLSQPDANAGLCAISPDAGHLHAFTPDERDAFVAGLKDGKIQPALWKKCAKQLALHLGDDDRASLFDAALDAYSALLHGRLDSDPAAVERAQAVQRFYVDRRAGSDAHAANVQALTSNLRESIDKKKLGRIATQLGQELLDTLEIEHGNYRGTPVDEAAMDRLAADGNELTLRRFADRLPTEQLRDEAQRRLVRIHIKLSPFPEVQNGGAMLEAKVLQYGFNAVDLAAHPVTRAWFDAGHVPKRDIVVQQHVLQRSATLLGAAQGRATLSVVPELPLHGALIAQLDGISRPITVCGAAKDLDPSPCIAPGELSSSNMFVELDGGKLRVADELAASALLPLAEQTTFAVGVQIGKGPAASFAWGLHFERPDDLVFAGAGNGGRGPDLIVRVADPNADRVSYDVDEGGRDYLAFVERSDVASYRVGSRGGAGYDGASGSSGTSGSSGGECQNGGDGGPGGDGDDGGNGGNGGNVAVQMSCRAGATDCTQLEALVQDTIVSIGGDGGRGGMGGAGGAGGAGGSSRAPTTHTDSDGNTVVDDPGCSGGSSGSTGTSGMDGRGGTPGRPGSVTF
ncbi:MAG TPA: hypothetical protein VH143_05290 [Kofleriaceae bacterium]|jgi:hypothetical protein|nr:hypothetical protein [Kofleriaceae bacterium]